MCKISFLSTYGYLWSWALAEIFAGGAGKPKKPHPLPPPIMIKNAPHMENK